jgi:hypothetical protein
VLIAVVQIPKNRYNSSCFFFLSASIILFIRYFRNTLIPNFSILPKITASPAQAGIVVAKQKIDFAMDEMILSP